MSKILNCYNKDNNGNKVRVLIFGLNGSGKKVLYLLDDEKYEVIGFLDNEKIIQGTEIDFGFCKVKVYSPDEIVNLKFDKIIIAINKYESEVKQQLIEILGENILQKITVFEKYESDINFLEERHAMLRNCVDEIYRNNVIGNVAELGVYKGDFAKYINRYFKDRKLYLFDTFEGFDEIDISTIEEIGIESKGNMFDDTSIEEVLEKMPNKDSVVIKKGYFPQTTVDLLDEKFCFVSIDADLYNPIKSGLEYFYPRLEHGGYIFIHDFGGYAFEGCKKAVLEYCRENNISYVPIFDICLSVIITK